MPRFQELSLSLPVGGPLLPLQTVSAISVTCVSDSSRTGATGVKPLGLPLKNRCAWFSGAWHHWHWIDLINVLASFSYALFVLTIPAPVVVFHRLHDEWKVGPELPFPRRIGYSQLVNVILSHVHSELKLQRGRKLFYHWHNHHLHNWTR